MLGWGKQTEQLDQEQPFHWQLRPTHCMPKLWLIFCLSNQIMVLSPILNKSHFAVICRESVFPLVVAYKLWNGLEQMNPMHHQKCVQLLYQLLNTPSCPASKVEKIITRWVETNLGRLFLSNFHQLVFLEFNWNSWYLFKRSFLRLKAVKGS